MNIKKRQLLTATLVIALGAAVTVNWYYNDSVNKNQYAAEEESVSGNLGDSVLVAGTVEYSEETTGTEATTEKEDSSEKYFSDAKLRRSKVNDELKDKIDEILADKSIDQPEMIRLENYYKEYCNTLKWQTDAENLIYAKTGNQCIVIINSGSCQVIVDRNTLNDSVIFQITEIIEENTEISAENLSIIEVK